MKNMDRWDRIKSTWLSHCGIEYAFVVGNPSLNDEYEWDLYTRVLSVRCEDDYEGLSFKTHLGVRAIKDLFNPDGIFKIDDDMKVNINLLHKFSENIPGDYCGKMNYHVGWSDHAAHKFKNGGPVYIPVQSIGGPLYYLSKKSIDIICKYMEPANMRYEDVCVSMTLNSHGILPTSVPNAYMLLNEPTNANEYIGIHPPM
jgi:hypothetical protein